MKGEERRDNILKLLASADGPVSAGKLAETFGVSRQIIVSDIARLREKDISISSLSRGYVLDEKPRCEKVFKVIHSDEDSEKELNLIVELGGEVKDVFVYHKFYGVVSAKLDIKTKKDVSLYLKNITSGKSGLLKNVTSGYHYHTVTADSEEKLSEIEERLWEEGFLAKLKEYEPREIKV